MKHWTDVKSLREKAWFGFSEEERSTAWLVLLDIIGPSDEHIESSIQQKALLYLSSCSQKTQMHSPEVVLSPDSTFKVQKQIKKDVLRINTSINNEDRSKSFHRAMELFARKYAVVGYVQGMCDIFKLFIDVHSVSHDLEQAEALSYFCFVKIVSNYLDYFSSRQAGIERSIEEIEYLIDKNSPRLFSYLSKLKIEIKYFAYNWMSTFLFREFAAHKEVFDAHFSLGPEEFVQFNVSFATGIVIYLQDRLMKKDFEGVVHTLQNIQSEKWTKSDIEKILSIAFIIYSNGTLFSKGHAK
ncbi:TBC1 domain family member 2 [Nematocida minor]|uniref:TBC1 domain family member 2 n=1 Tax=Nematocida minor TaxID=1912983 RepID=UPI00221FBEB9|nr:TBC1 domain family member 2 [Nematocida minor]KAI5192297.1 TBC1 domain family member 2 [Nematocida minor]